MRSRLVSVSARYRKQIQDRLATAPKMKRANSRKYGYLLAADVREDVLLLMIATQWPIALQALNDRLTSAAWTSTPSWQIRPLLDPLETFSVAVGKLNDFGLGYLHVVEQAQESKDSAEEAVVLSTHLKTLWNGLYVVNGGYDGRKGEEALRSGHADAVAYGRAFLANPDLPRRLQLRAALNEPDPTTFYGGGADGYTSYPTLS